MDGEIMERERLGAACRGHGRDSAAKSISSAHTLAPSSKREVRPAQRMDA